MKPLLPRPLHCKAFQQSFQTCTPWRSPQPRAYTTTAVRPFLSSLLGGGGDNNDSSRKRHLTASRVLPYAPAPLFRTISAVESYSSFLPFLTASTVTARDERTGLPSEAFLTVGYGPLSETFTSKVDCDERAWVVEARSGGIAPHGTRTGHPPPSGFSLDKAIPGANEGIFEYMSTRWELVPLSTSPVSTKVQLEIRFELRSQLHAAMMGAVEGQMASLMIEAFERRIRDTY